MPVLLTASMIQLQAAQDLQSTIGTGLEVTAIGMGVVFGVLVLLYGLMVLIGRLSDGPSKAGEATATGGAPPAELVEQEPPGSQQALVAAAVAAALVAAMETGAEEQPPPPPPRGPQPARGWRAQMSWELAGRMELVTSRGRLPRG